jgi:hypothetical protein
MPLLLPSLLLPQAVTSWCFDRDPSMRGKPVLLLYTFLARTRRRVYTLARYLMRDAAEDAVQECYLRALRHFDTYRGPAMKPWLLAILRNVCKAEFARRATAPMPSDANETEQSADEILPWQEPQLSPEAELLRRVDGATIRRLIAALPQAKYAGMIWISLLTSAGWLELGNCCFSGLSCLSPIRRNRRDGTAAPIW